MPRDRRQRQLEGLHMRFADRELLSRVNALTRKRKGLREDWDTYIQPTRSKGTHRTYSSNRLVSYGSSEELLEGVVMSRLGGL
jgi:hypothetical protein